MRRSISSALIPLALLLLAGCLPQSQEENYQRRELSASLVRQYANSAVQFATLSMDAASVNFQLVTGNGRLEDLGISLPDDIATGSLDSGVCIDDSDPDKAIVYIYTWFVPQSGTDIIVSTVGSQSGRVAKEIARLLPGANSGVMKSGSIMLTGLDGTTTQMDFPAGCALPVPESSPVIAMRMITENEDAGYPLSEEWYTTEEDPVTGEIRIFRSHTIFVPETNTVVSTVTGEFDYYADW